MRNFVVRVYHRHSETEGLVSGIVEDIESGKVEVFQSFDDLKSLLAYSIENGHFGLTDGLPPE
jgi:hypothetical protein